MKLTTWLNSLVIVLFLSFNASGQTLSYEEVQEKVHSRYPLVRQRGLLQETEHLLIANIQKGNLPQLSITGQASYQSDVTRVSIPVSGISVTPPEKDQYRLTADVSQTIFDGGINRQRQTIQKLTAATDEQKLEVELYRLRDVVDELYFGILLLEEQEKQVKLIRRDLETGINKTRAQVANGVAFRSNLDLLRAESLKTDQRIVELQATRQGLVQSLNLLLGEPDGNIKLTTPVAAARTDEIRRPELTLYSRQTAVLEQQKKLINAMLFPRLSIFGQAGYGRPGLNMLNNEFDLFYIAGVRLNWNLVNLYTARNDKKLLDINKNTLQLQRDAFLLNTNTQLSRQLAEIQKLETLIATDREIILLRESVKNAATAQLENAVITANDYLREVNAEDQAKQALIIHQIQLLQANMKYQTIAGN